MNGIVFPSASLAAATALRAAYDAAFGYPKAGVDVGGGRHALSTDSVTVTCAAILMHPTLPQVAIQESAEMIGKRSTVGVGAGAEQALDATWFG